MLAGACPAYGEGTAYRALERPRPRAGRRPAAADRGAAGRDEQADAACSALGLPASRSTSRRPSWALRRLLERVAAERPLVVAVEDVHWAQDALLDLLDHVVTLSSGAPILLLCLARPELLERRARRGPRRTPRRAVLVLDALADGDAHAPRRAGSGAERRTTRTASPRAPRATRCSSSSSSPSTPVRASGAAGQHPGRARRAHRRPRARPSARCSSAPPSRAARSTPGALAALLPEAATAAPARAWWASRARA